VPGRLARPCARRGVAQGHETSPPTESDRAPTRESFRSPFDYAEARESERTLYNSTETRRPYQVLEQIPVTLQTPSAVRRGISLRGGGVGGVARFEETATAYGGYRSETRTTVIRPRRSPRARKYVVTKSS
jgi:hypothetical protein